MYIAELHGKFHPNEEKKEDILTSDVFSFFKYARRDIFLYYLLTHLKIDIEKQDAVEAQFLFWPKYEDGTEPDLVVIVGNQYLLFEAKFQSGFGEGLEFEKYQILREIQGGETEARNMGKEFKFIAITAHYARHKLISDYPYIQECDYRWINWHQVSMLVSSILAENLNLDIETRCFAEDLIALLEKKKLRKYAGIEGIQLLSSLTATTGQLFLNPTTVQYRGDFIGFIQSLVTREKLHIIPESFFFHRKKNLFQFVISEKLTNKPDPIFFGGQP